MICLLSLSLQCLGNKNPPKLVDKVDFLINALENKNLQINNLRDSLDDNWNKVEELEHRLSDYEEFKGESKGNDSAVWEYGSSIVGILTGIIILFGIVYYMSSKQAARDAFDESFDSYVILINEKVKRADSILDILDSRVSLIDEGEKRITESSQSIKKRYDN